MPLLKAAVKERSVAVDEARIRAWWHLIQALGPSRHAYFNQVGVATVTNTLIKWVWLLYQATAFSKALGMRRHVYFMVTKFGDTKLAYNELGIDFPP